MVQLPAVTPVTVPPLIVQTPAVVELKVTGFPESPPVAETNPVPPTIILVGGWPKVIVWGDSCFVTGPETVPLPEQKGPFAVYLNTTFADLLVLNVPE